jgi:hypothetical protein
VIAFWHTIRQIYGKAVVRFELFRVFALGSRVIGANMQCKLFVPLQLEVAHHFIKRSAGDPIRGFEPPATF